MSRKSPKTSVVAFKVEEALADVLNQLPNKSEFIRKAIAAQMSMACPLCHGAGQVSRTMHDRFVPIIRAWTTRKCQSCGGKLSLPADPGDLNEEDLTRLEQFFKGGPLYCDPCFEKAPACDDCGWHIAEGQANEHQHAH